MLTTIFNTHKKYKKIKVLINLIIMDKIMNNKNCSNFTKFTMHKYYKHNRNKSIILLHSLKK